VTTLEDKYAELITAANASGATNIAVRTQDNVLYIDGVVPTGEAEAGYCSLKYLTAI